MNEMLTEKKQTRVYYLDFLRILAAVAVIMIHVSAQNWETVDIRSFEWQVFAAYNTAVSWPVNMFIMLSGVLFLDNDRPLNIKKLYTNHIFRLVTAFVFWSGVYAADLLIAGFPLQYVWNVFLQGHFHQWYLFMAAGYYVVTPVFRKITESKRITEYFLIVTFVYIFLIPSALSFLRYFKLPATDLLTEALSSYRTASNFGFSGIFVFYFVYGFYLFRYDTPAGVRRVMPILALLGYLGRVLLCNMYVQSTGDGSIPFDFCVLDLPVGTEIFLFAKYTLSKIRLSERAGKIVVGISACTFGMYLSHAMVMYKLQLWMGLTTLSCHPILAVPLVTAIVAAGAFAVSWLLHQVPVLKKYVV